MLAAQGVPPTCQTGVLGRWTPCDFVYRTSHANLDALCWLLPMIIPSLLPHVRYSSSSQSALLDQEVAEFVFSTKILVGIHVELRNFVFSMNFRLFLSVDTAVFFDTNNQF